MTNPGFEAGLTDWQLYTGTETITTDAFAGTSALALAADGAGVQQSFDVVVGESYTLSAYAKATGTAWSGIGLQFYDAQSNILDGASIQVSGQNWSQYTLDALAPTGAVSGVLWAWKGGSTGTTTLDNFGVSGEAPPPPPPPTGDLLLNSSFESGIASWGTFSGTETIATDTAAEGIQSLKLTAEGSGVRQAVTVTAGETYEFTAFAKTSSTGWSGLGLEFLDSAGNIIDGFSQQVTTTNWSEYQFEYTAPNTAMQAAAWIWKGGANGSTYWDNVSLQQLTTGPVNQPPTITSNGGSAGVSLSIQENITEITNINATDPDGDTEGNGLTYSLEGPDLSLLSINPNTGALSFKTAPDFETPADANGDNQYEVTVVVSDPQGAQDTQALSISVTDVVEVSPSTFALANSNTIFVNEAAGVATVSVVRSGGTQGRATLEYTTNEVGTATANADYTTPTFNGRPNTGQIVFEDGEAQKSFTIPILDDTAFEGNETFAVGLQNPSAGSLGTPRTQLITIVDNDAAPTISISEPTLNVAESTSTASITVQRSGDTSGSASVNFSTSNGTATAGNDYATTTGTLNFAPNQTTQTLTIPILNDLDVEGNEAFTLNLSNPVGAVLGSNSQSTITILDNDLELGALNRNTAVSGLTQPTTLDWTPDDQYLLVAEKAGRVRVVDSNGTLRATPLIDLSSQVNGTRDRGLLGLAIHPNFPSTPYVYLAYTYDPPETVGRTGLGGPDGNGNRPSRVVRVTVNPSTMVANPNSLVVLAGTNSNWQYTSEPTRNSTGNTSIRPSGIVNGTTVVAPANQIDVGTQDNDPDRPGIQNQNVRDYLATDSESHSIGDLEFGPDGYLYLSNGDGTSYTFADPRTVRVQDVQNLSGKVLRIDPITGDGIATNPFFDGDADSNQSKVFYSGLRNPFRFAFDPVSNLPVIGDVGWNSFEEINTGPAGSNFGWPYFEGPNQTGGYQSLAQAIAFYNNGNRNNPGDDPAVFPILSRTHGAPDRANAITVGDFYNSNTLMFGDVNGGTLYAATLDNNRQVTNVQVFDSGIPFVVDMKMGPDGRLYGVDLVSGRILRWDPVNTPPGGFVYNGNSYRLSDSAKTWTQAQAEAQSVGGNLVTINNAAEETWLKQTFGEDQKFWIGLNDTQTEGQFQWVSGEPVTYTNWAPNEPNNFNGDQDFGVMNFGGTRQWDDDFSTSALRGIIEIPGNEFVYNGKRYRLTNGLKTWSQAQAEAQSLGGNLVTINNAAEETWLKQTFGENQKFWIGLNDTQTEGQFRWVNGEPVTYTNWAPGEPNNFNGTQDFGVMNFGSTLQWDDDYATAVLRGIIELPGS
ncbi:MAG: Calx-beta domain-containing protein [Cyanobacteria bacterium J06632_22]